MEANKPNGTVAWEVDVVIDADNDNDKAQTRARSQALRWARGKNTRLVNARGEGAPQLPIVGLAFTTMRLSAPGLLERADVV